MIATANSRAFEQTEFLDLLDDVFSPPNALHFIEAVWSKN
jgi:hypothetical protein